MQTRRVRIAVAVDPKGKVGTFAWNEGDEKHKTAYELLAHYSVIDWLEPGEAFSIVVADVPVPINDTEEIEGALGRTPPMSADPSYRPAWLGRLVCRIFGHLDVTGWSDEMQTAGYKCLRCKRVRYVDVR